LADAPLERMDGTGFFTSTLDRALLAGEIDVAGAQLEGPPLSR
jgi:porphobilinogen deaminase